MKEETKQWLAELEKPNPRIRAAAAAARKESAMNEPIPEAVKAASLINDTPMRTGFYTPEAVERIISTACEEYARRVIADKLSIAMQQLQQQLADLQRENEELKHRLTSELGTKDTDFTLDKSGRVIQIRVWEDSNGEEILCPKALLVILFEKDIDERKARAEKAEKELAEKQSLVNELGKECKEWREQFNKLRADVKPLLEAAKLAERDYFLLAHPEFEQ